MSTPDQHIPLTQNGAQSDQSTDSIKKQDATQNDDQKSEVLKNEDIKNFNEKLQKGIKTFMNNFNGFKLNDSINLSSDDVKEMEKVVSISVQDLVKQNLDTEESKKQVDMFSKLLCGEDSQKVLVRLVNNLDKGLSKFFKEQKEQKNDENEEDLEKVLSESLNDLITETEKITEEEETWENYVSKGPNDSTKSHCAVLNKDFSINVEKSNEKFRELKKIQKMAFPSNKGPSSLKFPYEKVLFGTIPRSNQKAHGMKENIHDLFDKMDVSEKEYILKKQDEVIFEKMCSFQQKISDGFPQALTNELLAYDTSSSLAKRLAGSDISKMLLYERKQSNPYLVDNFECGKIIAYDKNEDSPYNTFNDILVGVFERFEKDILNSSFISLNSSYGSLLSSNKISSINYKIVFTSLIKWIPMIITKYITLTTSTKDDLTSTERDCVKFILVSMFSDLNKSIETVYSDKDNLQYNESYLKSSNSEEERDYMLTEYCILLKECYKLITGTKKSNMFILKILINNNLEISQEEIDLAKSTNQSKAFINYIEKSTISDDHTDSTPSLTTKETTSSTSKETISSVSKEFCKIMDKIVDIASPLTTTNISSNKPKIVLIEWNGGSLEADISNKHVKIIESDSECKIIIKA